MTNHFWESADSNEIDQLTGSLTKHRVRFERSKTTRCGQELIRVDAFEVPESVLSKATAWWYRQFSADYELDGREFFGRGE